MSARQISIFEVSPRDGLQNETAFVPTADKIRLIDLLSACGFARIEAASFVSPRWVPQMADAEAVLAGIRRRNGVSFAALTPNFKGYARAHAAKADEVAIFASASEAFSQANLNCSIAESFERFRPVVEAARADGTPVRGYVSCVVACPFSGPVAPAAVANVARQLLEAGVYEVSLGDTIGAGTPPTVRAMLEAVAKVVPPERLAGHFHDTGGAALGNIEASLEFGLSTFDASVGGLGGCPYAPGARGNVDTLAVAALMRRRGCETGLDLELLEEAAAFAHGLRSAA